MNQRLFVLGFVFDPACHRTALILKNRPADQAGKLNAPGGKIEDGESPRVCMSREFQEECTLAIWHTEWKQVGLYEGADWQIGLFGYICKCAEEFDLIKTGEPDQPVTVVPVNALPAHTLPSVRWLIPMTLSVLRADQYPGLTDVPNSFRITAMTGPGL